MRTTSDFQYDIERQEYIFVVRVPANELFRMSDETGTLLALSTAIKKRTESLILNSIGKLVSQYKHHMLGVL